MAEELVEAEMVAEEERDLLKWKTRVVNLVS